MSEKLTREECIAIIEAEVPRLVAIEKTARALVDDVKRRYPGEPLRCPLMRDLDAACRG